MEILLNTQSARVMLPGGLDVILDPVADQLYIRFSDGRVESTREEREGILIDFGEKGEVIGVSLLHPRKASARRNILLKRIANRFSLPGLAAIRPEYLAKGYAPVTASAHGVKAFELSRRAVKEASIAESLVSEAVRWARKR